MHYAEIIRLSKYKANKSCACLRAKLNSHSTRFEGLRNGDRERIEYGAPATRTQNLSTKQENEIPR